jgi:tight adherence protein B
MDAMAWTCSLVMGLCVAGAAYWGATAFQQFVDWVEGDLNERLRSLRVISPHLRRWLYFWLGLVVTLFFALWLGGGALTFAAGSAVLLSAGPWYLVRRMSQQRRQKIEDQLADAMVMFSGAVRAGLSIPQALEILAVECPLPIRQEFAQLVGEYRMGRPLERALEEGKSRLKSENFVLFAAALLASRESGGRLNETVERISKSILEIQRLERKVVSETAQARKSALYMAVAPVLILLVYFYVDPVNTRLLFATLPGQVMLSVAVALNLAAYGWARVILSPEI